MNNISTVPSEERVFGASSDISKKDDVGISAEVGGMDDRQPVQISEGERAGAGDLFWYIVDCKGVSAATRAPQVCIW